MASQENFVGTMIRGRVAFGSRGAIVRVRTTDEPQSSHVERPAAGADEPIDVLAVPASPRS